MLLAPPLYFLRSVELGVAHHVVPLGALCGEGPAVASGVHVGAHVTLGQDTR